jgi:predicted nucleic acid-binding protein
VIVTDASAIGDVLLENHRAPAIEDVLAKHSTLHVPEHFHLELVSMLRSLTLRGELAEHRRLRALDDLHKMRIVRYSGIALHDGVWELRDRLSAYDAAYLALARTLDLSLLTSDAALADAARAEGRLAVTT